GWHRSYAFPLWTCWYDCLVWIPAWFRRRSRSFHFSAVMYSRSRASRKTTESSESEPRAMSRKRRNSLAPLLADPSAMFATVEKAARRAWDVSPYSSLFGNDVVVL